MINTLNSKILSGLTIMALLLTASPLLAQSEGSGSGFRITPLRHEVTVERGSSETRILNIRNISSSEKTASAVINDFKARDDETGVPQLFLGDENLATSIKPFVENIPDVTLQPGEEKDVPVTITIPDSASPGSYYGVIRFIDEFEGADTDNSNVALSASVGSIFLVQVPGETVDLLSLEEIFVSKDGDKGKFFSTPPNEITLRISNQGNTFQAPFGKILVKDWNDNIVHQAEFNNGNPPGNVLPDSTRAFLTELENIGSFGRYTVEANLGYSDGGSVITASTSFWVVPWTTIAIGALALVGLAFLATKGIKRYNQAVIKKSRTEKVKKK